MNARLSAALVIAVALTSSDAVACVGLGEKKAIDCIDESGGKNCSCTIIRNACTATIDVNWIILGGSRGGASIAPGKSTEACTTRRGQSVSYTGHTILGGGSPKTTSGPSPTCDALSRESKAIYDQLKAVNDRSLADIRISGTNACSTADWHEKRYKLKIELVNVKRRDRDAGCGTDDADVRRFAKESFDEQKAFVDWSQLCKSRTAPKTTTAPYQPSRPSQPPSSSNTSSSDLTIHDIPTVPSGNNDRRDQTPPVRRDRPSDLRLR